MDDALERFDALLEAFDTGDPSTMRHALMRSYGLTLQDMGRAPQEIAERELEFAMKCLKGEGPNVQETLISGDLREVLLIEIGIKGRDQGPPWLRGDWRSMASIISRNALIQLERQYDANKSYPQKISEDVVRLWPVNWGVVEDAPGAAPFRRDAKLGPKKIPIQVLAHGAEHLECDWIGLPDGPSKYRRYWPEGIPPNMWNRLEHQPISFNEWAEFMIENED